MAPQQQLPFDLNNAPVELDLAAVPVPMTKDRALAIQAELKDRFGSKAFQDRLRACAEKFQRESIDYKRLHMEMCMEVQAEVIPKYGFEATPMGVAAMRRAVEAVDDDEVGINIQAIDCLLGKNDNDFELLATYSPQARTQAPLPPLALLRSTSEPHSPRNAGEVLGLKLERSSSVPPAGKGEQAAGLPVLAAVPLAEQFKRRPPCQLDIDDLSSVPMTKERALGLQAELKEQFSSEGFQLRLGECEQKFGGRDSQAFKKAHQQMILDVESQVIPKYGYKATMSGIMEMRIAILAFEEDPEVRTNTETINRLAGKPSSARKQR